MAPATLWIGIMLDLATAIMLSYVGLRVRSLPHGGEALRQTALFWIGGTLFMLLDGGFGMVVLLVDVPLQAALGVLITRRLAFAIGWLAFGAWLARLNGRTYARAWWTYGALLAGAIFIQTWLQGVAGYEMRTWSVGLLAARPTPVWLNVVYGVALFVPTAWQALRLLAWCPRLSRLQCYRAIVIGTSVTLFCILVVAGFVDNDWYWYGLLENRSVFTVATGVLLAMRPPWVLRRYGIPRMTSARQFPGAHHAQPI